MAFEFLTFFLIFFSAEILFRQRVWTCAIYSHLIFQSSLFVYHLIPSVVSRSYTTFNALSKKNFRQKIYQKPKSANTGQRVSQNVAYPPMAIKNIEPCTLCLRRGSHLNSRAQLTLSGCRQPGCGALEVELDLSLAGTFCRTKISTLADTRYGERGSSDQGQCLVCVVFSCVLCGSLRFLCDLCVRQHSRILTPRS